MMQPPFGERFRYYLGFHLPVRYREWVEADIASASYVWRDAFFRVGAVLVAWFVLAAFSGRSWATFIGMLLGALVAFPVLLALGGWQRRRNLRRHRLYWGVAGEMSGVADDGLDPMQRFYRRRELDSD